MPSGLWPNVLKRADKYRRHEEGFNSRAPDMLYFLVKEKCEEFFAAELRINILDRVT
jgi:hypothetical protein